MLSAVPATGEPVSGQLIGRITIDARDIFDTSSPDESGWIYRTANILHIQTVLQQYCSTWNIFKCIFLFPIRKYAKKFDCSDYLHQ
jgi:hypothetical protein